MIKSFFCTGERLYLDRMNSVYAVKPHFFLLNSCNRKTKNAEIPVERRLRINGSHVDG